MFLWVTVYLKKKLSNRELNSYRKISKVKEHFGKKNLGGKFFGALVNKTCALIENIITFYDKFVCRM